MESPCPQVSLSFSLNIKSLSLDHKVLENCQWLHILQIVYYVWSRYVHKFGYRHRVWVTVYLLNTKPIREKFNVVVLEESRGSSRAHLQEIVLVSSSDLKSLSLIPKLKSLIQHCQMKSVFGLQILVVHICALDTVIFLQVRIWKRRLFWRFIANFVYCRVMTSWVFIQ